ncbi:MAG: ABC transporter substrate-binding protein [Actinomycetota bacterium]|nr:ABC transporter substrate-binding protein [Actinomycetota bacterium]
MGPRRRLLEAITALKPDLIFYYLPDDADKLARIAPTVVYDVTVPGGWQRALHQLGAGTDRDRQAADAIEAFGAELGSARRRLAPVVSTAPRISVIYLNYRGSTNTYVFGREFALAQLFPRSRVQLVGIEEAAPAFSGVGMISPELLGGIDTIIAVGPVDWTKTASAPILSSLDVPVLGVKVDEIRPSAGPLSSPQLLRGYVEVLARHYRA